MAVSLCVGHIETSGRRFGRVELENAGGRIYHMLRLDLAVFQQVRADLVKREAADRTKPTTVPSTIIINAALIFILFQSAIFFLSSPPNAQEASTGHRPEIYGAGRENRRSAKILSTVDARARVLRMITPQGMWVTNCHTYVTNHRSAASCCEMAVVRHRVAPIPDRNRSPVEPGREMTARQPEGQGRRQKIPLCMLTRTRCGFIGHSAGELAPPGRRFPPPNAAIPQPTLKTEVRWMPS